MCDRRLEQSQGVSKGSPFGLLGLFQRRRADALEKALIGYGFFLGGKAAVAKRPMGGRRFWRHSGRRYNLRPRRRGVRETFAEGRSDSFRSLWAR